MASACWQSMALLRRRCRNRGRRAVPRRAPLFNTASNKQLGGLFVARRRWKSVFDGDRSRAASCHKDEFWKEYTMKKLSARNQLKGKILEVKKGATTSHVRIDIGNGIVITSSITNEAVADLNLTTGDEAWAVIKASDVMIGV